MDDHYSGELFGVFSDISLSPLKWINRILTQFVPLNKRAKYDRIDLGSELGHNYNVVELTENKSYTICPTDPKVSHQNAPDERPHQTICNALCSILIGETLPLPLWNYSFQNYLRINKYVYHSGNYKTPHEIFTK